MANNSNGNSCYVDSIGALATAAKNIKVLGITLTASAANAQLVLKNNDAGASVRLDLRNPTAGSTVQFRFDQAPIVFSNGINVLTILNGNATIVYTIAGG